MRKPRKSIATGFALFAPLAAVLILLPCRTSALSIGFDPSAQTVVMGDSLSIDLVISGLGNGGPPSLGAFDLDIAFDTGVLSFVDYSLGAYLGDLAAGDALDLSFGEYMAGTVNVAEISFLLPGDLDLLQPDSFALATLTFDTVGLGTTSLDLPWLLLSDGYGQELMGESLAGSVTVVPSTAPVPEPGTMLLLTSGLLGMGIIGRKARRVAA